MTVVWVNHYFSIALLRSKFLLFLSAGVLTVFPHVLQCRDETLLFIIQLKFYRAKYIQTDTKWTECRIRVDEGSLVEFVKISIGEASLQEK